MKFSIIYYIAYKTGYIQRNLNKKLNMIKELELVSAKAAVSPDDLNDKFTKSLEESELVIVIGGLSAGSERNVMTVLSEYFTQKEMDVTFNKKVVNPEGGHDGYLIKSGSKYIAVLPDEPEEIDSMVGSELMKNIDITPNNAADMPEPVRTHSIVFAPEPDYSLDRLNKRGAPNILLLICMSVGAVTVLAAIAWILTQLI